MLNLSMSQSDLTRVLPLAWQNSLVLGGSGNWARQELPVAVEAGVKKRVDGVVGRG